MSQAVCGTVISEAHQLPNLLLRLVLIEPFIRFTEAPRGIVFSLLLYASLWLSFYCLLGLKTVH